MGLFSLLHKSPIRVVVKINYMWLFLASANDNKSFFKEFGTLFSRKRAALDSCVSTYFHILYFSTFLICNVIKTTTKCIILWTFKSTKSFKSKIREIIINPSFFSTTCQIPDKTCKLFP